MGIDRDSLRAIIQGDQEGKVQLKRKWLSAVNAELEAADRVAVENARLKAQIQAMKDMSARDSKDYKAFKDLDDRMDSTFGKGSKFDKIFGRGFPF